MAVEGYTMSPPYGGLDLVSPIDNMDPIFALELINIFPGASAPELRKGYTSFATLSGGNAVNTLRAMPKANGTTDLLAISGTKIFRIIADGTVSDVTGSTALTSSNCSTEIFSQRMYICNGVDTVQVFNGTTNTTADSTFTGVTLANLINVSSYKKRLYFVEKGTLKFWYGNTASTGGSALTGEDLDTVFTNGGFLLFAGSYTNQTAATSQDLFFVCSSEGEVIFYSGSYPGDSAWQIVARYYIGNPLGYNAFVRVNQDVWIITAQGIVPVSALFQTDPQQAVNTVSAKINPLISEAAKNNPFTYRWQGAFYATGRRVYITVPLSDTETFFLVWSIDSKGWTKFEQRAAGDAISIAIAEGLPYYGSTTGVIYRAETGLNDDGQPIQFQVRGAFSFYGSRGNYKAFKDIRPLMRTQKGVSFNLGLDTDFRRRLTLETITTSTGSFTAWGTTGATVGSSGYTPWGSSWSGATEYVFDRYATRGQGHSASIRFSGAFKDVPLQIYGFEVRFDLGGQV